MGIRFSKCPEQKACPAVKEETRLHFKNFEGTYSDSPSDCTFIGALRSNEEFERGGIKGKKPKLNEKGEPMFGCIKTPPCNHPSSLKYNTLTGTFTCDSNVQENFVGSKPSKPNKEIDVLLLVTILLLIITMLFANKNKIMKTLKKLKNT